MRNDDPRCIYVAYLGMIHTNDAFLYFSTEVYILYKNKTLIDPLKKGKKINSFPSAMKNCAVRLDER